MPQGATIFAYCEGGIDASFWAEPLNAITNGGFIVAAVAGVLMVARRPPHERSLWHVFFVANFIAIGIGSFLFHTVPNVRTEIADTGPIGLFMLTYLVYSLRRFAGASWLVTLAAIAVFIGAMYMAFNMKCWDGRMGLALDVPEGARAQCMNGSLGYGPAFASMVLIGLSAHAAAPPGRFARPQRGGSVRRLAHLPLARQFALRRMGGHGPSHGHAFPMALVQLADAVSAAGRSHPARRRPKRAGPAAQGQAAGLQGVTGA